MGQATHEHVELLLRLYDLRREPRLRQAREWFVRNFHLETMEQRATLTPEQDANVRMVASYWDMVANIVKRGLVDEDLFFETTGEFWVVWDRLKPLSAEYRKVTKDPHSWENLEKLAVRYEIWRERRAPGCIAATRELIAKSARAAAASRE
ncbi:MAG TPA: DUF4760 domain-containing protein [Candidatus Acidoferrales bacterium]|nr:DUF4760 domain-containing protein [Candidatus Acidoferrales bacterium]